MYRTFGSKLLRAHHTCFVPSGETPPVPLKGTFDRVDRNDYLAGYNLNFHQLKNLKEKKVIYHVTNSYSARYFIIINLKKNFFLLTVFFFLVSIKEKEIGTCT